MYYEADKAQFKMLIQILHKLATILNFQLPQLIVILSITMHATQAEWWACKLTTIGSVHSFINAQ